MPAVATRADALRVEYSSTEVRHLEAVGTLDGVGVLAVAARNGVGTGYLRSYGDGTLLAWKAPGGSYGPQVDVSAGGSFLLEDGDDCDKWARVSVTASRLATTPAEARVLTREVFGNGVSYDDVTAEEASAGDVQTWELALANDSHIWLTGVKVWIDASVSGLQVSPNGADWSAPTTEATALDLADIEPAGEVALHLKRTIGAGADPDPDVLNWLNFVWEGG